LGNLINMKIVRLQYNDKYGGDMDTIFMKEILSSSGHFAAVGIL